MISNLPVFSGRPWHSRMSPQRCQRGVSIITGIFLLLLMAVLAAVIASVVSTAHVNQAADIGGARAYQAARAGAEWGMYQLDPNAQVKAPGIERQVEVTLEKCRDAAITSAPYDC